MSTAHENIAHAFERSADDAKVAEMDYRRTAAAEIARLETERVTAFRRVRLVRLLEDAVNGSTSADDVFSRQRARLCEEFGWRGDAAGERAVLDRLEPVCAALAEARGGSDVATRLREFEAWFQADRGVSFYALFDQYRQETPVVDF